MRGNAMFAVRDIVIFALVGGQPVLRELVLESPAGG
jgi:hypothetical protein